MTIVTKLGGIGLKRLNLTPGQNLSTILCNPNTFGRIKPVVVTPLKRCFGEAGCLRMPQNDIRMTQDDSG